MISVGGSHYGYLPQAPNNSATPIWHSCDRASW